MKTFFEGWGKTPHFPEQGKYNGVLDGIDPVEVLAVFGRLATLGLGGGADALPPIPVVPVEVEDFDHMAGHVSAMYAWALAAQAWGPPPPRRAVESRHLEVAVVNGYSLALFWAGEITEGRFVRLVLEPSMGKYQPDKYVWAGVWRVSIDADTATGRPSEWFEKIGLTPMLWQLG